MGFVCPRACGTWRSALGPLCANCRCRTSVTAGDDLKGSRKLFRLWFIKAWEIMVHKFGANAVNVKCMPGINSYKTGWSYLDICDLDKSCDIDNLSY